MIVVRAASGVGEIESAANGEPMLLGVVAAEFLAVVKGPRLGWFVIEAVVAGRDVGFLVVAEG